MRNTYQTYSISTKNLGTLLRKMDFSDILALDDAAKLIWTFDDDVAGALDRELGAEVWSQKAGRSHDSGSHIMVTFRVIDTRQEARGMENYIQLLTDARGDDTSNLPPITIRMFAFEEGHRRTGIDGKPMPVYEKEYQDVANTGFSIKAEYERSFISPYTYTISEWEEQRLETLSKELREFCEKRHIDGPLSVANFSRYCENNAKTSVSDKKGDST